MEDFKVVITKVGEKEDIEVDTFIKKDNSWTTYDVSSKEDLMLLRRLTIMAMNSEMRKHREKKLKEG